MEKLPDKLLIEAYFNAKDLVLEQEFCDLLKQEINCRGLLIFETLNDKEQS